MNLETSLEQVQNARTAEAAFTSFAAILSPLGFDKANHSFITDHASLGAQSKYGFATSYPADWVSYYTEHGFQKYDPVWARLLRRSGAFSWRDAMAEMRQDKLTPDHEIAVSEQFMRDASDAGLADGIGISFINQFGEVSGIAVSKKIFEKDPSLEDFAKVTVLATALHDKITSTFSQKPPIALTKREKDVLSWAAEGKTDSEIAQLLGVTHHTVRFHWNNLFRKFDMSSKLLVTMTAIRKRLVQPAKIGTIYVPNNS
ncbi:hypothetical protein GG681_00725 [Epibacterium sp. SM1969]|uniref:HTH luxR-type domain-containing protein n=1 Tax=Tritonibacter aquimaris TaxID=2663379 RepID=A0A844AJK4_9RHOB|nr:autoinducer binding domain-containing protein [Tritonibacter aquimaris]MQY41155.1 hypothetical protein [Tritonibacter aquimaris]